jgi:hypothetical protein
VRLSHGFLRVVRVNTQTRVRLNSRTSSRLHATR